MYRLFNRFALFISIVFLSGCIISHSPLTSPLVIEPGDSIQFTIIGLGGYTQWYVDGNEIPGAVEDLFVFEETAPGEYLVKVIERGGGLTDSREWTVIVNHKPSIWGTPETSVPIDTEYAFTPTAEDLDDDSLVFAILNQPDWAEFDPASGTLSGTPAATGIHPDVTIGVTDGTWAPVWLSAFDIDVTDTTGCTDGDTRTTTCGFGACLSTGEQTCIDSTWSQNTCTPSTPSMETCDNIDNDCDGAVDEALSYATTCGLGACDGNTGTATCTAGVYIDTCDPFDGAIDEACNGLDDDCNGAIDDGIPCDCTDGDTRPTACGAGACASTGTETCASGLWGSDTCTPGTPSAEICDNVDNDCNGDVDDTLTQATSCGTGACAADGLMTCTDGIWGTDTCTPGAPSAEVCNNIDDDCDGAIDEGVLNTFFADDDTDGYGNPGLSSEACSAQAGYVADNTDCDDSDAAVHPGASEIACDNIDQDCDGNDTGTYAWQVEPVFFDFGIIKQEKEFSVENTGSCPIDVSVDDSGIAEWAGVTPGAATLQSSDRIDIVAAVDRSDFVVGEEYSTAFTISSADVNDAVSIEITASAGDAKILFCVDTSGSMEWNDPDSQRVDAVKEAINMFYDNPHIEYAVVQFNSTAETLTDYTDDFAILMDSADALAPAAGWTTYLGDESYTPGALDEIDRLIDGLDTDTRYVVLFLSDGEPKKGVVSHDAIVSRVEDIASPINVKMYTIFLYDGTQADAYQLLDDMAVAGGTYETHIYIDADSLSFVDLDF